MAGKPAIQVVGAKELRKALTRMGADLTDMRVTHLAGGMLVADRARSIAPRLTGALAGSIKATATKTRGVVQAGGRSIPYAGPIHFGWPAHNIVAQPFLYDAIADERDSVVDLYERRVGELVERVGRETP